MHIWLYQVGTASRGVREDAAEDATASLWTFLFVMGQLFHLRGYMIFARL